MSTKALIKAAPWVFPAGVELTWQPPDYSELGEYFLQEKLINLSDEFDREAYKRGLRPAVDAQAKLGHSHMDCTHCVEYPTPIQHGWKQFKKTYKLSTEAARACKMQPSVDGATTGMGHIHVGKLSRPEMFWALRDMLTRPYVSWALVHPSDDINARPLAADVAGNRRVFDRDPSLHRYQGSILIGPGGWKKYTLRHASEYKTMEWRAFDAPEDWQEQARQMALVQRYFAWVREQVQEGVPVPELPFEKAHSALNWLDGWELDMAKDGWEEFITGLGLPYDEYEYWVTQNMEPRFEWGVRN